VLRREGRPSHLPFYEHIASAGFIARATGQPFDRMRADDPAFWKTYVNFWMGLGFDCVPLEVALKCPLAKPEESGQTHASEAHTVIRDRDDFERYPWPNESDPIDFEPFEIVARLMPEGARIVGGVCMGPFEWASRMMGLAGLCEAVMLEPDLAAAVLEKLGSLIVAADRQLASMDAVGALRQGDDLGFKTSTFLSPDQLRELIFPIYARLVGVAHDAGKPFILHSCGNLERVYHDLIDLGIDAKHSFEEVIMPVEIFKQRYGDRVTPLGGLDVDLICRGTEQQIRRAARLKIEACFADGAYALGTGNSLTDYMPVENYLIVLEEGARAGG
jgi:uroporphyrinogen decarboxylase